MLDGRTPLYDDVRPALDDVGGDVAVAGNAPAATVEGLLAAFDLSDRVGVAVGREPTLADYARRLPDTTYLDRALGTRDALFVGDGNVDLVAADRAGVDSAFVRRPHRVGYELTTDPTYELASLCDLPAVVGTGSTGDSLEPNRVA